MLCYASDVIEERQSYLMHHSTLHKKSTVQRNKTLKSQDSNLRLFLYLCGTYPNKSLSEPISTLRGRGASVFFLMNSSIWCSS